MSVSQHYAPFRRTNGTKKGVRRGKRGGVSSETPQKGLFNSLSFRETRNEQKVEATTGVFRALPEDVPSSSRQDLTTTTVRTVPSEATARTKTAVTIQSEPETLKTSSRVAEETQISDIEAPIINPVTVKTGEKQRRVFRKKGSELSTRNDTKNLDSSEIKPGESEPSGDIAHHKLHSSGSVSEALAGSSFTNKKLEFYTSVTASEEQEGMHPAVYDTGQQYGVSLSVVPQMSRASSPGTVSSSGSSYNFSSTTEATGDSRGLKETPMGSTTGLLPDSSSSTQSKYKENGGWMPGISATLTIISLAAGLGNVLRLPRVVYLSGGGVFLLVYVCITLVFGIPLVFLEIGLGQFCQEGATKLWRAVPLFKGVGYVKVLASALLSIYYPVLMGLSLFYLVWCSKGPIPFTECAQHNSSMECLQNTFLKSVTEDAMWFGVSVAFLFLLWALLMLCIFSRERSYIASLYVIIVPVTGFLVAVLADSIVNDDSVTGLNELMTFHWDYLLDIKVWYFATVQMFFSTHLGFGNIVTCAGRIYSKSNALWTAVSYVVTNLVIGILSVCIIYQWNGQIHDTPTDILEGFIYALTYDVAVNNVENDKQLWPVMLFFIVIICTGFIAMVAVLYTVMVALTLEINKKLSWWILAGCICTIGFLTGIVCIIPDNMEMVHILDHYVVGRMVLVSIALELVAFAWIYGSSTLYNDFEFMLGRKLNPFWKVIWIITPVLLIVVEVWSMVSLPLTGFPGQDPDPVWVYVTGWALYSSTWIIVIAAALQQIVLQVDYNLSQKFLSTLKPSRNWGPVDTIYRHWWVQWRVTCNKTGERDFTFKRRGTKDYTSSIQKYHTTDPAGTYRAMPPSVDGTLHHNRSTNRGPFTIQTNGDLPEHVCWRGSLQQGGDGT